MSIKFDIIKTRLTAPPKVLNAVWQPIGPKIKPKFTYRRGHSGGYTDDLGIIADDNHWVYPETPGWYSDISAQDYMPMREWCEQNLKHGDWCTGVYYIILQREEDVAWFLLRWA